MEPAEHPSYGPSYFLQMLATLGIWLGLSRWGRLSSQEQQYEVILLWMFLFRPLSTLIHELGHALAVRRLARRPAEVTVGPASPALRAGLGQVSVSFSPVPLVGSRVAGICRYRPDGIAWSARGWISLAGPGATMLELLVMLGLAPLWLHGAIVLRDVCAVGSAMLAVNLVTNLMPTPLVRDEHGQVVLGHDGWNAREAFRNARAGAPALGTALAAGASASLPEVEAGGGTPAPRTLADIWTHHDESVARTEDLPAAKSASEQLARGDFAQRALAEIWSGVPDDPGTYRPPGVSGSVPRLVVVPRAVGPVELVAPVEAVEAVEAVALVAPAEARLELAASHLQAGRVAEAIPLLEAAIITLQADVAAGADEFSGLATARATLANAYLATRHPQLAIGLYELLLADASPAITHGQRLGYRIKLAQAFRATGRADVAIEQLEALVAETDTAEDAEPLIDARVELATTYVVAHRVSDGVDAYELALPRIEQLLGADHRKSLSVRLLLARAYQEDGRLEPAIRTYRELAADAERALGPDDTVTRQASGELAAMLRNQRG